MRHFNHDIVVDKVTNKKYNNLYFVSLGIFRKFGHGRVSLTKRSLWIKREV